MVEEDNPIPNMEDNEEEDSFASAIGGGESQQQGASGVAGEQQHNVSNPLTGAVLEFWKFVVHLVFLDFMYNKKKQPQLLTAKSSSHVGEG